MSGLRHTVAAISNTAAGRFGISEQRLRRLAALYECDDPTPIYAPASMTGGRSGGWWDEYRGRVPPDFLDLAELEHHAASPRTLQTAHLPGMFHRRGISEVRRRLMLRHHLTVNRTAP